VDSLPVWCTVTRSQNLSDTNPNDVETEYQMLYPHYKRFAAKLHHLLEDMLSEKKLDYHKIESRAKEPESFFRKIKTHKPKYKEPLRDVPDIVGVRLIVYYRSDMEVIESLLRQLFDIDVGRSDKKLENMRPNEFGYLSNHYVVSLPLERSKLPEWKPFSAVHAEIQVRTVLEHAWAVVSHKLAYKHKDEAPESLQRGLFRLSALLEESDDKFCTLKRDRDGLAEQYRRAFGDGTFDCELNLTSLVTYLEVTNADKRWSEAAVKVGFRPPQPWLARDGDPSGQVERALLERLRELAARGETPVSLHSS
jgi:putative GTP pyrophosphokinase